MIMEKSNAATRQKSCNACVRGKRRCDKKAPRCTRCAAKGLDCVYQKLPPSFQALDAVRAPDTAAVAAVVDDGLTAVSLVDSSPSGSEKGFSQQMPAYDMGFDLSSLDTDTSPESMQTDGSLPSNDHSCTDPALMPLDVGGDMAALDFSIMDLITQQQQQPDFWDLQSLYSPSKMDIPPVPSPPPRQPLRDVRLLRQPGIDCEDVDVLTIHDKRSRLGAFVHTLTSFASTFALSRSMPFMHPRLYAGSIPKTVLSAFSASAVYHHKTPETHAWALRLLSEAAREIHREGERAETPAEKLGRLQALFVVSTLRIFDGDVSLRAAVDREITVLMAWVEEMVILKRGLEDEENQDAPKSWDNWIFLESARRTIMVCFAFICLHFMLKHQDPGTNVCAGEDKGFSFTSSRSLWHAGSSVEFYRAWRDKPRFVVRNMDFRELWAFGSADEMDDFTKAMLIGQTGIDAYEHFIHADVQMPTTATHI